MLILKKDGFWAESNVRLDDGEWDSKETRVIIEDGFDLVGHWKRDFQIAEGVTCGDFFMVLADMDEALLSMIEVLVDSNIKSNLRRAFDPLPPDFKDDDLLSAVEVYKSIEIDNYENLEEFRLKESFTSAHGIGKPWEEMGGSEDEKLSDEEKAKKGLNTYAIEFTPWNELSHLPLTIRKKMYHCELVWKKAKRKKLISNGGDEDWNYSERGIKKRINRELGYEMSLGEFFAGFANELCFFGDPEERDEQKKVLMGRIGDVEELLAKEKLTEEDKDKIVALDPNISRDELTTCSKCGLFSDTNSLNLCKECEKKMFN